MKTAWKTLSVAAALFSSVGITQAATTACMDGDGPGHSRSHLKKMAKYLGLDAIHKSQVKDILTNNHVQAKPIMDKLIQERRAMRTLIQSETFDETAIRAQSARVATVETDLAVNRAQVAQKLRAILTPDQLQKSKTLQEKRDYRMDERRATVLPELNGNKQEI
jgi:Spy/CpxP family protein refolding chaperone